MSVSTMPVTIRPAIIDDVPTIVRFIRDLADYEQLLHEVTATEAELHATLFASHPKVFALMACEGDEPVGFALYFFNYSTFLGKHGLYVEDVYVTPAARGKGVGRVLFQALAREALAQDCGRMEWWVLDWNQPAIDFYRQIGATPMDEWTVQRMDRPAIEQLASQHVAQP